VLFEQVVEHWVSIKDVDLIDRLIDCKLLRNTSWSTNGSRFSRHNSQRQTDPGIFNGKGK